MNVYPLDMQVVIPKATEVSKIQQVRDHQDVIQQDYSAIMQHKEGELKQKQVQNTEKSFGKNIDRDGRGKSSGYRGKKRQEQPEQEEVAEMAVDTSRGLHIDLKC